MCFHLTVRSNGAQHTDDGQREDPFPDLPVFSINPCIIQGSFFSALCPRTPGSVGTSLPSQEPQSLFLYNALKSFFGLIFLEHILREEKHANAVLSLSTQFEFSVPYRLWKKICVKSEAEYLRRRLSFLLHLYLHDAPDFLLDAQCVLHSFVGLHTLHIYDRLRYRSYHVQILVCTILYNDWQIVSFLYSYACFLSLIFVALCCLTVQRSKAYSPKK